MAFLKRAFSFVKAVVGSIGDDRILVFSGYVAYACILAMFPFIIFLVALASFVGGGDLAQDIITRGFALMPDQVMETLAPVVAETMRLQEGKLLTFGIVGTLWAASAGIEAFRDGLNVAHHLVEKRPMWKRRLQGLGVVFIGSIFFMTISFLLIAAPLLIEWIGANMGFIYRTFGISFDPAILFPAQILRFVIAFALLTSVILAMYRLLPDTTYRWRTLLPGAMFASTLWMLLASVFSLYLTNFGSYNVTYGSLGGIIATIAFFQFSVLFIFIGAEVNVALYSLKGEHHAEPRKDEETSVKKEPLPKNYRISINNAS